MDENKPDYLGHRQRLRERFLKSEGNDMADYELLEILLMLAIPRKDVKPLAKKLINAFGCFANVICAPEYRLSLAWDHQAASAGSDALLVLRHLFEPGALFP